MAVVSATTTGNWAILLSARRDTFGRDGDGDARVRSVKDNSIIRNLVSTSFALYTLLHSFTATTPGLSDLQFITTYVPGKFRQTRKDGILVITEAQIEYDVKRATDTQE